MNSIVINGGAHSLRAEGWDLTPIVKELRRERWGLSDGKSLQGRRELPSHDALVMIARSPARS